MRRRTWVTGMSSGVIAAIAIIASGWRSPGAGCGARSEGRVMCEVQHAFQRPAAGVVLFVLAGLLVAWLALEAVPAVLGHLRRGDRLRRRDSSTPERAAVADPLLAAACWTQAQRTTGRARTSAATGWHSAATRRAIQRSAIPAEQVIPTRRRKVQ